MTELERYIHKQNLWLNLDSKPPIKLPLSPQAKAYLLDQLECDLSPENLCCDGELRGQALRDKQEFLDAVADQLSRA